MASRRPPGPPRGRRAPLRRWRGRAVAMVGAMALLTGVAWAPLHAQAPALTTEQEREAVSAMSRLRSPVTPFHTVDMCPSAGALRDTIRMAAAAGMSGDAIVEDVVGRYGEELRLLPRRSGVGLLAWIATPLLLLGGATLVALRLRRDRARSQARSVPVGATSDADRERIALALRGLDDDGALDP